MRHGKSLWKTTPRTGLVLVWLCAKAPQLVKLAEHDRPKPKEKVREVTTGFTHDWAEDLPLLERAVHRGREGDVFGKEVKGGG